MFGIVLEDSFGRTKIETMAALKERGVDTRSFFYPMSQQPALKGDDPRYPNLRGEWPVSDDLGRRGFYLPSGIGLSADQIAFCAETLTSLRR
jgi:perosamine synthetase